VGKLNNEAKKTCIFGERMQAKTDDSVIKRIPTILLGFDFICQWQYITSAIAWF